MFTGVAIYGVLLLLGLAFLRGASKVSGNHQDPFRDVGNGGCTVEQSFIQFARENPGVNIDELAREHNVKLPPGYASVPRVEYPIGDRIRAW